MAKGKTKTRIYKVTDSTGTALVRASTKAQAVRRFTHNRITVEPATQDDIIEAMKNGVDVLEEITEGTDGE